MNSSRPFSRAVLLALALGLAGGLLRAADMPPQPAPSTPPAADSPEDRRAEEMRVRTDSEPLRLGPAIARSLANVQSVRANVAVQTATVGRFEALKAFVPLIDLPQLATAFRRFGPSSNDVTVIYPDVTDGTPLVGQPRIDHANLDRVNMFFPLDPSGQITALPIAEEGIRAKLLMEQLVRRSQVVLAAQQYFEAKQVQYGLRTARLGLDYAHELQDVVEHRLREKQAHDVELTQARVDLGRAAVLLSDLEKSARITQRELGIVLHTSRLLVPQEQAVPINLDGDYRFDLADPDLVDLAVVPDFPCSREDAIERAKRQRLEVRLLVVGLNIARLQEKRDLLHLLGAGKLPIGASFKNSSSGNGGVAFGMILGTAYDLPVLDLGLWSNIRRARLDLVRAQLELEAGLIDVAADAGNSWDRWHQANREYEQREREVALRREYLERQERLLAEKQSIQLDVLGTQVALLQADANRWTSWYNLQLARLDVLRSTELLLDFVEKARIADLSANREVPHPSKLERFLHCLSPWQSP